MTAVRPNIAVGILLTLVTFAAYEKEISPCIDIYFPVVFAFAGKPGPIPNPPVQNGIAEGNEPDQPVFYGQMA